MNDFDYDAMNKKRIARGAKKMRVGGSPTALTPGPYSNKEIQDKNGPCYTMNMGKPMTWVEFKFLPVEMQAKYLRNLMDRFGIQLGTVGMMFGQSPQNMCHHNKRKWHLPTVQGMRSPNDGLAEFKAWIASGGDKDEKTEDKVGDKVVDKVEDKVVELKPLEREIRARVTPRMNFTIDDTMTFMELGQYIAPLAAMYGKDAKIHFRVVMTNEP